MAKTRDEVIGSVVERVIPEGWHVARNSCVREGDVGEWGYGWSGFSNGVLGYQINEHGWTIINGQTHLVIRQDAPEPGEDTAKLKATIAERDETIRWYKQLESQSKARIAELEKERDAANAKLYSAELATSKHELNRALSRGDAYYAELGGLKAKVAELEERASTLCKDWEAQTDAIRRLKEENMALRTDRDLFKKWHGDAVDKLAAVKKAWEGA